MPLIRIEKIEGESEQGFTRPLFCEGADAHRYVVKGKAAGRLAMTREWIAARLGTLMGLPIPPFTFMELHPKLLEYDATGYAQRIGPGYVFGSRRLTETNELLLSQAESLAPELRSRILLFDWWIANSDRTLTESGGNPNLLWDVPNGELAVIDHNLAFDLRECGEFWATHIFKSDAVHWDKAFEGAQKEMMRSALQSLETIWGELPEDWIDVDVGIDFSSVESLLWRFDRSPEFWSHP